MFKKFRKWVAKSGQRSRQNPATAVEGDSGAGPRPPVRRAASLPPIYEELILYEDLPESTENDAPAITDPNADDHQRPTTSPNRYLQLRPSQIRLESDVEEDAEPVYNDRFNGASSGAPGERQALTSSSSTSSEYESCRPLANLCDSILRAEEPELRSVLLDLLDGFERNLLIANSGGGRPYETPPVVASGSDEPLQDGRAAAAAMLQMEAAAAGDASESQSIPGSSYNMARFSLETLLSMTPESPARNQGAACRSEVASVGDSSDLLSQSDYTSCCGSDTSSICGLTDTDDASSVDTRRDGGRHSRNRKHSSTKDFRCDSRPHQLHKVMNVYNIKITNHSGTIQLPGSSQGIQCGTRNRMSIQSHDYVTLPPPADYADPSSSFDVNVEVVAGATGLPL